jgi:hypothetical protein
VSTAATKSPSPATLAPPERSGRGGAFARARSKPSLIAFLLYLGFWLVLQHKVVAHMDSVCACNGQADPSQFMWALVWWPHALLHGLNPFVTHVLWAPVGVDLARATSVPGAALVMAPITALAGPLVSFNVVSLLAPVLGAWSGYFLCRYVTRSPAASILGGFLYGFSAYELIHLTGLLHMALIFTAPIAVLLTLQRLDGVISGRRFFTLLALVLVVQLSLSVEMLLTSTCMGAVALAAGWAFGSADQRWRIVGLLPAVLGAYAAMAIIGSPLIYYALFRGSAYATGWGAAYPTDALNLVVPTIITWPGGHEFFNVSNAFGGSLFEDGGYVGWPVVIIVVAFGIQRWRARSTRVLLAVLAVAVVWSLGSRLYIVGHATVRLPWWLLDDLPLLDQVIPARIALYTALVCAVIVAIWVARGAAPPAARWGLGVLAAFLIIPASGVVAPGTNISFFNQRISEPAFFTTDLYRKYLTPGEVVLPIPYAENGLSMLWQARTGMYFRMASGYFGTVPPFYASEAIVPQLRADTPGPNAPQDLESMLVSRHIGAIVAEPREVATWGQVIAKLHLKPVAVGGVLFYRVPERALG